MIEIHVWFDSYCRNSPQTATSCTSIWREAACVNVKTACHICGKGLWPAVRAGQWWNSCTKWPARWIARPNVAENTIWRKKGKNPVQNWRLSDPTEMRNKICFGITVLGLFDERSKLQNLLDSFTPVLESPGPVTTVATQIQAMFVVLPLGPQANGLAVAKNWTNKKDKWAQQSFGGLVNYLIYGGSICSENVTHPPSPSIAPSSLWRVRGCEFLETTILENNRLA